ncbi:3-deoxy-manno-octulosonate cytidylyltransferase [Halochromatium roseum]|uniref:3-deoxy-manno-octulosonate cytidylyltransferase n=1 Tax=Halochromatium roseum TaxID=391920 RepID=UPI0019123BC8|nr:manno-octulosonate cytidylyltransferase [Halochromatium roseum]
MAHSVIVIPARFGSSRLPGKPLANISGRTLLQRVCDCALAVREGAVPVYVATDDERIAAQAQQYGATPLMTPSECPSGTDRVHAALAALAQPPNFIVNMQGDAPFTSPATVSALLDTLEQDNTDVVTAYQPLTWDKLDQLRRDKTDAPFSGTTVVVTPSGRALWFSKNIIPALRDEARRRVEHAHPGVLKHVGIYGYRRTALERIVAAPPSFYERCEGLEQLRFLELDMIVRAVPVPASDYAFSLGVDSPADLERANAIIAAHGEPPWAPQ